MPNPRAEHAHEFNVLQMEEEQGRNATTSIGASIPVLAVVSPSPDLVIVCATVAVMVVTFVILLKFSFRDMKRTGQSRRKTGPVEHGVAVFPAIEASHPLRSERNLGGEPDLNDNDDDGAIDFDSGVDAFAGGFDGGAFDGGCDSGGYC